ncbi:response regulator transcription factor [Azospirillum sp. B4]|uniref:response regulator transcription factor n=1 Tax=Azospirillum sp. B4 TaxID=95605 RepID=UPI00034AD87B|nr:response regulator transcription factor [Azospirillum sp. B4]
MIRVVLAEDQVLLLGALAALLSLEDDIKVVAQASDGPAALAAVRTHHPDVLVNDIEMPGLTGLDLAEAVRTEGLATRVVIVTTFGRPGYLQRALRAGVRGYLLKDVPPEVLTAALRQVARGGRVLSPELAERAWNGPADPLTNRERAMLRLADGGRSNKEIALALDLSPGTVRNYISEAIAKVGAAGRVEAARIARENGWL